ncbi:MAG: hypothetical protein U9R08_00320 [Nanoarchaeota archaeon]|nr:hypothetical protein [Nanoarchaeota archaeon]
MKVITIFNSVRDLTYHCPESKDDVDHRCWGKHRILYDKLNKAGYKVRYRVCEFRWDELKIPKNVSDKAPKELDVHLYLEIKLDNKWINLDCSNDPTLKKYNEWDGKSDTELQVKCRKILSPKESAKIEEYDKTNYKKIIKKYHELYTALNKFLDKIRQK